MLSTTNFNEDAASQMWRIFLLYFLVLNVSNPKLVIQLEIIAFYVLAGKAVFQDYPNNLATEFWSAQQPDEERSISLCLVSGFNEQPS